MATRKDFWHANEIFTSESSDIILRGHSRENADEIFGTKWILTEQGDCLRGELFPTSGGVNTIQTLSFAFR